MDAARFLYISSLSHHYKDDNTLHFNKTKGIVLNLTAHAQVIHHNYNANTMSLLSLKKAWTTTHNEYNQFNTQEENTACRTKIEEEGCELCAYSLATLCQ